MNYRHLRWRFQRRPAGQRELRGFTLVELLVVIAIIGVLVALLIPAVQAAREAGRRVQCKSQLKQLALAALTHHEQHGHFPTGGWSQRWLGDPDRGFGPDQPGGWAYNVLPFIEESALYALPADGQPNVLTQHQLKRGKELAGHALPILYCPSRRPPTTYAPVLGGEDFVNAMTAEVLGKADYAINVGDTVAFGSRRKPKTWQHVFEFDLWCYTPTGVPVEANRRFCGDSFEFGSWLTGELGLNGISFERSGVRIRDVTDGTSTTYLIGEKYLGIHNHGHDTGDAPPWNAGCYIDICRSGQHPPLRDGESKEGRFGSPHPTGCHMSFCDGSIRTVGYDIDPDVHRAAANRNDGMVFRN